LDWKWAFQVNQNKEDLLQWAYLRPDSTAVNSWAVKMLFERELIETKIKEKDTRNWKLQNNFSDFG
jgi:hypothetical protein